MARVADARVARTNGHHDGPDAAGRVDRAQTQRARSQIVADDDGMSVSHGPPQRTTEDVVPNMISSHRVRRANASPSRISVHNDAGLLRTIDLGRAWPRSSGRTNTNVPPSR